MLTLLIGILALAAIYYIIITFFPLPEPFLTIVKIIVGILAIYLILQAFGVVGGFNLR